jgi:hypothetical protein
MATVREQIQDLKTRAIAALGGVPEAEAAARTSRAFEAGFTDAAGNDDPQSGTIAGGGFHYRRATTKNLRDFGKVSHEKAIDVAWSLFQSSPLAERIMKLKRDYIVGGVIKPETDDDDLQEILNNFWGDNELSERIEEFVLQFKLFGEQCYPVFIRESDGRVRLGYIDPIEIDSVIPHPENAMQMCAVMLKRRDGEQQPRIYRIVRKDDLVSFEIEGKEIVYPEKYPDRLVTHKQVGVSRYEPWELLMLSGAGLSDYTGSCIYRKSNALSNQPRGWPELLQLADWIDQHDETLFALADREQFNGYFSWFVNLVGADDTKVKERAKALRASPPKRGSVNVSNDAESWDMKVADLKQTGSIATTDALSKYALGGKGVPWHWYGDASDTNRSSAAEQSNPAWKTLEAEQRTIKRVVIHLLTFARDQAAIAGNYNGEAEADVTMPKMNENSLTETAQAASQMASALIAATDAGWITDDTAARAWAMVMREMDVEYDPAEELEAIAQAADEAGEEDQATRNQQLVAQLAQVNGNGNQMPLPLEADNEG